MKNDEILVSKNNFDLIRLVAATQVAVHHTIDVLSHSYMSSTLVRIIELFPGVPIFFFISGFLISRSYEKSHDLKSYARNRALRIFPGLHFCVAINIVLVALTGYFMQQNVHVMEIVYLYLAKTTIFQFYNPDFMRAFGDGVLNGSLWTICVELQFYILVPFVYSAIEALRRFRIHPDVLIAILIGISLIANRVLYAYEQEHSGEIHWKLLRASFLPWFYMFLFGVLVQRNFQLVQKALRNGLLALFAIAYLVVAVVCQQSGARFDNGVGPYIFFPLAFFVLYCGYTRPAISDFLAKNDISYGVYIYHMVFANMFLYYGMKGELAQSILALSVSYAAAAASWFLLEKPCMRMKVKAYRPLA